MRIRNAVVVGLVIWIAGLAVVFIATPAANEGGGASSRTLDSQVQAAGVQTVSITASDGEVSIIAADDDTIAVRVDVVAAAPTRVFGRPGGNPAQLTLDPQTQGDTVSFELRGGAGGVFEERWTVTVPARVAARIRLHDGRIHVRGITGGVTAQATAGLGSSPGEMDVDVPSGALDLSLRVGAIRAATAAARHGEVEVASRVGKARLFVGASEVIAERGPGSGHRLRFGPTEGSGPPIKVSVGVGDAVLRLR